MHMARESERERLQDGSVLSLSAVIASDVNQITWLQNKGLLPRSKHCPASTAMTLQSRSDITDKFRWTCPDSTRKKTLSMRSENFFDQSCHQLQQWIVLMYWWARQYPVSDAAEGAEVDKKTAIQIYQYCRDICSWRLLNHDSPLMLGGPGVVLQIDESSFGHKPKHHQGCATTNEVWVFGMCDTSLSPGLCALCPITLHRRYSPSSVVTCKVGVLCTVTSGCIQSGPSIAASSSTQVSESLAALCGYNDRGSHPKC